MYEGCVYFSIWWGGLFVGKWFLRLSIVVSLSFGDVVDFNVFSNNFICYWEVFFVVVEKFFNNIGGNFKVV